MADRTATKEQAWPALPLAEWKDTCDTLHMWMQIVGKTRLALCPYLNHWWEVPLYISARGLTTSPIPYASGIFEAEFDFIEHVLRLETSRGETEILELVPRSVANFYDEYLETLRGLGIEAKIWHVPVEVPKYMPAGSRSSEVIASRSTSTRALDCGRPLVRSFQMRPPSRLRATRNLPWGTNRCSAESIGIVKRVCSSAAGTARLKPKRLGKLFEISVHFSSLKSAR